MPFTFEQVENDHHELCNVIADMEAYHDSVDLEPFSCIDNDEFKRIMKASLEPLIAKRQKMAEWLNVHPERRTGTTYY